MMNEKTMKVGEIAIQLGVDRNTVRNWCRRYAPHLSETANPPLGGERLLTTRDVNILTYIHTAVNDGVSHDEIAVRLGEKAFNDHEIDIVVGEEQDTALTTQPTETPQDAPQEPLLLPAVLTAIDGRIEAMERRLEAQIAETRAVQRDRMSMFIWGAIVGLIGALALFTVAYLLVTVGVQ
jgi:DNA-binding transcriptional MerR regulator